MIGDEIQDSTTILLSAIFAFSLLGYSRVPQNRKSAKICALTRQPQAIFSHKPQPSVFFSTINILFKMLFRVNEAEILRKFD